MQHELISVIVPVYNIETFVGRCINSILCQTYENLEIIIVNDGSTDHSGEICHEIALNDFRIQVIDQENSGLSEARNAGLRIAKGAYVAFVDGDDYIDNQMYEVLHDRLIQDDSDLALCNIRYVDENGYCTDENRFDLNNEILCEKEFWGKYFGKCHMPYVVSWNKLYKTCIFKNITFDKGKIHEDEFILHKIVSQCERISVIKDSLYNYVQRSGSIMNVSYSVQRLQAVEACNQRISYFVENDLDFTDLLILRMLGLLVEARENLDFSYEINREKYNEVLRSYKKSFWCHFRKLNRILKIKGLMFLYCNQGYLWLRRVRKITR